MHPDVHSSTVYNSQEVEGTDEWIKMIWGGVCVYVKWNISHKKEQNNAIYSNVDATRDYHIK